MENYLTKPGYLVGIGVGPGDPRDLTLRAIDELNSADIVVAPCSANDVEGRAESIVKRALPNIEIRRLVFDMSVGLPGSNARKKSAQIASVELEELVNNGSNVAFITLGDPNVFSTFSLIASEVKKLNENIQIKTVPGIMAFQKVASESGTNLLDETEKLFLVTANDGLDDLSESLQHMNAATVIYKGGRNIRQIRQLLSEHHRLRGTFVGELIGLEGERVELLDSIHEESISYLATVIVPPVRNSNELHEINE